MKEKLLLVWSFVRPCLSKMWAWSPFACGLIGGYFGKPVIKEAIVIAAKLMKLIVG